MPAEWIEGGIYHCQKFQGSRKAWGELREFFFLPFLGEGCWQSIFPQSVNFVPETLQTFGQGKVQNKPINVLVRDRDQGKRKQGKKGAIG